MEMPAYRPLATGMIQTMTNLISTPFSAPKLDSSPYFVGEFEKNAS
jgi:hypothetical protein